MLRPERDLQPLVVVDAVKVLGVDLHEALRVGPDVERDSRAALRVGGVVGVVARVGQSASQLMIIAV